MLACRLVVLAEEIELGKPQKGQRARGIILLRLLVRGARIFFRSCDADARKLAVQTGERKPVLIIAALDGNGGETVFDRLRQRALELRASRIARIIRRREPGKLQKSDLDGREACGVRLMCFRAAPP